MANVLGKKKVSLTTGKTETCLKRGKGTDCTCGKEKRLVTKQAFQEGKGVGKFQSLVEPCSRNGRGGGKSVRIGYEGVISQLSQSLRRVMKSFYHLVYRKKKA